MTVDYQEILDNRSSLPRREQLEDRIAYKQGLIDKEISRHEEYLTKLKGELEEAQELQRCYMYSKRKLQQLAEEQRQKVWGVDHEA